MKDGLITGKNDVNDIYRKSYLNLKKTYLNSIYQLLQRYAQVGVGISPIVMYFLTHKITRKLHLHFLLTIVRKLFPLFRYFGRTVRSCTRVYKTGWDSITQKSNYYEKVVVTKLATLPTRLRPVGTLSTPVQAPVPGEARMNQTPLQDRRL